MSVSNADNITKRIDVNRKLTYVEMDENFNQLKLAIGDLKANETQIATKLTKTVYDTKVAEIDQSITDIEQQLTEVVTATYVEDIASNVLYRPGSGVAGEAGTASLNNTEDFESAGTTATQINNHVNNPNAHPQYVSKDNNLDDVDPTTARQNLDVNSKAEVSVDTIVRKTSDTGGAIFPAGTDAQRPTSGGPYLRYNLEQGTWEGSSDGVAWGSIGGGATGAVGNEIFVENDQVVTGDYTIASNRNAMTTGPITIADGVTVTISDGARWVII